MKVVGVEIEDEGVKVSFEDGSEVKADIVVGADGLRSVWYFGTSRRLDADKI